MAHSIRCPSGGGRSRQAARKLRDIFFQALSPDHIFVGSRVRVNTSEREPAREKGASGLVRNPRPTATLNPATPASTAQSTSPLLPSRIGPSPRVSTSLQRLCDLPLLVPSSSGGSCVNPQQGARKIEDGNLTRSNNQSQIEVQLGPSGPPKGSCGQLRSILRQTHLAAGDVEHLGDLVGEDSFPRIREPKRESLSLPPRIARMRPSTLSFRSGKMAFQPFLKDRCYRNGQPQDLRVGPTRSSGFGSSQNGRDLMIIDRRDSRRHQDPRRALPLWTGSRWRPAAAWARPPAVRVCAPVRNPRW